MDLLQNFVYSFGLNLNAIESNLIKFGAEHLASRNLQNFSAFDIKNCYKTNQFYRDIIDTERSNVSLFHDSQMASSSFSEENINNYHKNGYDPIRKENISPILENKRMRNMFSSEQICLLEKVFEQTHYPDQSIREQLSSRLNLNAIRIQVWFQNRRAKFRKLDSFQRKNSASSTKKSFGAIRKDNPKIHIDQKKQKPIDSKLTAVSNSVSPILNDNHSRSISHNDIITEAHQMQLQQYQQHQSMLEQLKQNYNFNINLSKPTQLINYSQSDAAYDIQNHGDHYPSNQTLFSTINSQFHDMNSQKQYQYYNYSDISANHLTQCNHDLNSYEC